MIGKKKFYPVREYPVVCHEVISYFANPGKNKISNETDTGSNSLREFSNRIYFRLKPTFRLSKGNLFLTGFTLIELMIAISILVGSIVSIIYSYIVFTGLVRLSKDVSFATYVASAKLEDIRSENFYDVDSYNNQVFYPDPSDIYPQDIRSYDLDYRGIVYVDDILTRLKQVTVVICWRDAGRTIGEDWVFENSPDPSLHPRPASPVTVTTYVAER